MLIGLLGVLKSVCFSLSLLSSGEYPYAKCFICGKMGHLSRSCSDNPKGLYAAGTFKQLFGLVYS